MLIIVMYLLCCEEPAGDGDAPWKSQRKRLRKVPQRHKPPTTTTTTTTNNNNNDNDTNNDDKNHNNNDNNNDQHDNHTSYVRP